MHRQSSRKTVVINEGRGWKGGSLRLTILTFIFVFVRGPLFRMEDLTELGFNRIYAWRTVNRLVNSGILEKFDHKSYGATEASQKWFRMAFGGGANDATFAYSAMAVEKWDEKRFQHFRTKLSELWERRADRIKGDAARLGSTSQPNDFSALADLMCEKMGEASYLWKLLQKSSDDR